MNDERMKKAASDILALVRGEPGPFMECEDHFFGAKRVDSSMKDAPMETDCGGMIITKSKMTYGQADAVAATVNLTKLMRFIKRGRNYLCVPFPSHSWHGNKNGDGSYFIGEMWWVIYSYLATKRVICGSPTGYSNSMEYLYDEILKRLESAKLVTADEQRRWFRWQ